MRTRTASRRPHRGSPPPMTPTPAGRPRAMTCSGAATRSTSPKPATLPPTADTAGRRRRICRTSSPTWPPRTATVPDAAMTAPVHAMLAARGLTPGRALRRLRVPVGRTAGLGRGRVRDRAGRAAAGRHLPAGQGRQPATTGRVSPSTSRPGPRPARRGWPARPGPRASSAAPRRSWSPSPGPVCAACPVRGLCTSPKKGGRRMHASAPRGPPVQVTSRAEQQTEQAGRPATPYAPESRAPSTRVTRQCW